MSAEPAGSPTPRVKAVHAQTRTTLAMALAFAAAAAVAVVVPHNTGAWLPLHLFLVGALLLAISGATRLFAVTWSAAEPVRGLPVDAQRWLIAVGTVGLAVGRERDLPTGIVAASGLCVTAALVLLGGLLIVETRRARLRRYDPAVHFYLGAVAAGIVGTGLGAAMVTGRSSVRDAHVLVNLLGLVGLVIAGTLPFFTATQARMKMSRRATPRRLHLDLAWLALALTVATTGALTEHPAAVAVGLAAYAAGLLFLASTLPRPGRKQLRWAGPRLVQLAAGLGWWIGAVVFAAARAAVGQGVFPESLVVALVLGGYVQILVGSLAYLAPVLRGGGHVRLTAGFATTRSWLSLAAGNVAAVAWIAGHPVVAVAAIVVLAADLLVRAAALAAGARSSIREQEEDLADV
jgi:nitrite reductase (NO-forming)